MSNLFGTFSENIIRRLAEVLPSGTGLAMDAGQLEHFITTPAIALPCVLIDFKMFTWEDLSLNVQQGNGFLQVRVGIDPEVTIPAQYFELQDVVYRALQGIAGDGFGKLLRVSTDTELRENKYCVTVIRFAVTVTDTAAQALYTTIPLPEGIIH